MSGEKLVSYWLEDDFKTDSDQKLFTKIQNIKSITGARFGDVLLAAMSVSLHKYFLRVSAHVLFLYLENIHSFAINLNYTGEGTSSKWIERRYADENRGMERECFAAE